MGAHCFIHAGAVFLITGWLFLAWIEFMIHLITDLMKCDEVLSFNQDQSIHLATKLGLWLMWLAYVY